MARGAAEQEKKMNALGDTQTQNAQNAYDTASTGYKGILANPGFSPEQISRQTSAALTPIAGQVASAEAQLGRRAAATNNTAGMVAGQRDIARTGAQLKSQAAWGVQNDADKTALSERDSALGGISNLYSPSLNSASNLYGNATNAMNARTSVLSSIGQGVDIFRRAIPAPQQQG